MKCTSTSLLAEILSYVIRQSLRCLFSSHLYDFSIPAHPTFLYFCIFARNPLALRTCNTSMGFLFYLLSLVLPLTYFFFTLYPFMSHHPSRHSYLNYFTFLGLHSISSPISQSALSVNTISIRHDFGVGRRYSVEKKSHHCQTYDYIDR